MTTAPFPPALVAGPVPAAVARPAGTVAGALPVLTATLWISVLTAKLALPGNVEVPLPVLATALAFLLATGRAKVSLPRLLAFGLLVTAVVVGQLGALDRHDVSLPAIALGLGLYAMFVVVVPLGRAEILVLLGRFQRLALVVAGLVGVQWACQLAGLTMPSLEAVLPAGALYQSYNYIQPLAWQSAYMKPNGVIMLEASHTSQLLAMAVVIEICLFGRWRYIAALVAAQLSTFGGTGFVLLLAGLAIVPCYLRARTMAALVAFGLVVAAAASLTPVWTNFAHRSGELDSDHSSGNGRFVEPYQFMVDRIANDRRALVAGIGPGNGKLDDARTQQLVMNPVVKAVVEYGLVAGIAWMAFIHGCVLRTRAPAVAALVVLIQYDVLNGALLVPIHLVYCYVLAAAHGGRVAEPAVAGSRT